MRPGGCRRPIRFDRENEVGTLGDTNWTEGKP